MGRSLMASHNTDQFRRSGRWGGEAHGHRPIHSLRSVDTDCKAWRLGSGWNHVIVLVAVLAASATHDGWMLISMLRYMDCALSRLSWYGDQAPTGQSSDTRTNIGIQFTS